MSILFKHISFCINHALELSTENVFCSTFLPLLVMQLLTECFVAGHMGRSSKGKPFAVVKMLENAL